jgi:FXSXX-COOH protein
MTSARSEIPTAIIDTGRLSLTELVAGDPAAGEETVLDHVLRRVADRAATRPEPAITAFESSI